jgi:hypothetical protein
MMLRPRHPKLHRPPPTSSSRTLSGDCAAPPAHFDEAQAEQALWQEFQDYDTSINNTLTEALRIHEGPRSGSSR